LNTSRKNKGEEMTNADHLTNEDLLTLKEHAREMSYVLGEDLIEELIEKRKLRGTWTEATNTKN